MSPPLDTSRVLSTLNVDGTRHWLTPRLARGRFLSRRRIVGYALIALFVALPFVRIGGRPAFLIDLVVRELDIAGAVFRPSDSVVLMLLGLAIVFAVFFATALFGRVWCGWGCPQTVYLELVFRPIERWLGGKRGRTPTRAQRVAKWAIYAALAFALANVFLAYFVGTDRLSLWILESPADHLGGFSLVVGVSALMLFDFGYFREQLCIVACPYGRLQSVLIDRQSLIVGYDVRRGEPRGKPRAKLPVVGDCVDCGACVDVCPTGIDIRDGLQMECTGCAQCIDACDAVMGKLKRPRGLIRYTSQDELAGLPRRVLRGRTLAYPALLLLAVGLLAVGVGGRTTADITIERASGPSFVELTDSRVSSQVRLHVENDTDEPHAYTLSLAGLAAELSLRGATTWTIGARKALEVSVFVDAPRSSFVHGERAVDLRIDDDASFERVVRATLLGPEGAVR